MIVERSGNHCHLSPATFYELFGYYEPRIKRTLINEKYYVAEEVVLFCTPELSVVKLPLLGPLRRYNQIEMSRSTQCARSWPLGESGDLTKSRGVVLRARETIVRTHAVCIASAPHAHIKSPIKVLKTGTIKLWNVDVKDCNIYFDPTITVDAIHLDNDWYNAINVDEGVVRVKNAAL